MRIGIITESEDARIALIPETVQKLTDHNEILVEKGAGKGSFFSDEDFTEAGATVTDRDAVLQQSELLIKVYPPDGEVLKKLSKGAALISSFQPFANPKIGEELSQYGITAFSMDMMPRSTIAQDKDVLSSMASLSGYRAVLEAATHLPRYFPMLSTAAGTIPPAKVLILGAGVAGLQAVATAKRLGSVVEAFDTRLAAKEEVQSLGAKFVEVEGAKDDKAAGGYAVEQTEEYKQKQRELIREKIVKADVVISTALLRGKKAPILVTKEMVEEMKPGSVIVDLAAAGGGNCELTENNKTIVRHEVTIIGDSHLESKMPMHASQLYSRNIFNFLKVLLNEGQLKLDMENDMVKSTCITHDGKNLYNN